MIQSQRVSIHTRHYWRVKHAIVRFPGRLQNVSIHTRHYWRVKPARKRKRAIFIDVSIHTRHYWRVKPDAVAVGLVVVMFQSTPAITGG